ncbi:MAG: AhpC/TSA family protein [Bacteroidales bacterium]|nr:AhpC/TSA family protein [Bacteroidales bacterium]
MKKILILFIIALFAASCSKSGYKISGTLENAAGVTLILELVKARSLEIVDSVVVDASGQFEMKGELENADYYILKKDLENLITLILEPGQQLTITGDLENIANNYEVTGSDGSKLIKEFHTKLDETLDKIKELNSIYNESLGSLNMAEIVKDLKERSEKILEGHKDYSTEFVRNNVGSLASVLVLYQQISPQYILFDPMEDYKYFFMVDSAIFDKYSQSDAALSLHAHVTNLKQRIEEKREKEELLSPGSFTPEIALPTPEGDTIKLSSTRGKIVLLDFWAAWCQPCRTENPNLVANYKTYHDKGFEIFQVSLDRTRDQWLKGIEDDRLGEWIHVSDLKYWNSVVVPAYYIDGIPASFLLDKEGKIIARNLRGEALSNKLKEIFE